MCYHWFMTQKELKKIIKDSNNGSSGTLNKYINWLIPVHELVKGGDFLIKKDIESLLILIKANFEIKSSVLHDIFLIEGYLNTRFQLYIKKKYIHEVNEDVFKSPKAFSIVKTKIEKKFGSKEKSRNVYEYFNIISFGSKVEFLRSINENVIEKIFYNNIKFSKKEFLKILRIAVEIRNIFAHNTFILHKKVVKNISIKPDKNFDGAKEEYFFQKINEIMSIFGNKGFKSRILKITKKWEKTLKIFSV